MILLERIEIINLALKIIEKEGYSSLFNGLSSSVFLAVFQNGTYFCMSKLLHIAYENRALQIYGKNLIISFVAAIITSIVINPISVVNTRMTMSAKKVS